MSRLIVFAILILATCLPLHDGAMTKPESLKDFLKEQGKNLGGLYGGIKQSYDVLANYPEDIRTELEYAKTIGDAVVPIIAAGLNFIPVVGPIISGIFGGLWSALSPLMESEKRDPVQVLQEQMLDYVDASVKAAENRMNETMIQHFREFFAKSIYGKNRRDMYICDKYSQASRIFTAEIKENGAVSTLQRAVVSSYLNDCDNFLKDTTEGFDYPEFADILWIPAVQTTLNRLSLLTEAIYWGEELGSIPEVILNFHGETTLDVRRQLDRFRDAMDIVRETMKQTEKRYDFSDQEVDGCRMQAMLPYFDTSLYPKGMPKITMNAKEFESQESTVGLYHAQYFYRGEPPRWEDTIMNCFMGPLVTEHSTSLLVNYFIEKDKSYEIRLIYKTTGRYSWKGYGFFGNADFRFGSSRSEYPPEEIYILETRWEESYCEEKEGARDGNMTTTAYSCYAPDIPRNVLWDQCKFVIERVLVGTYTDPSESTMIRANCEEGCVLYGIEVIQLGTLGRTLMYI